jgi:aromatic ring hydroxylase
VRELMGAGVFQMPADASVLEDAALNERFESYWSVPGQSAKERMKLFKLAWDLLGSDFAGRRAELPESRCRTRHPVSHRRYLSARADGPATTALYL